VGNKIEIYVVPLPEDNAYSLQVKLLYDKKELLSIIRVGRSDKQLGAKDRKVDTDELTGTPYEFLRPFQRHPVLIFPEIKRIMLAFDLGLGKTVTSMSMIRNIGGGALIIATKSLLQQWKREIKKWFPEDQVVVLEGTKQDRLFILDRAIKAGVRWIIMNYEFVRDGIVRKDNNRYSLTVEGLEKYCQIYDEMYKIKNYKSQVHKSCKHLSRKTNMLVGLTGTPMETNLYEFYTAINFIKPGTIMYMEMERNFVIRDYFGSITGYKNLDQFNKRVSTNMIRVDKREVLEDLPELEQEYIFVETEDQYDTLVDDLLDKASTIFEVYTILRMLDSQIYELNPDAVYYDEILPYVGIKNKAKMNKLLELMSEVGNNQVLIFSFFKGATEYIKESLSQEFNIDVHIVSGDTNGKMKERVYDKFREGEIQVVSATDTWAYGIDLPDVNYLINWDLLGNPAKMYQRVNRIYRMNSSRGKKIYNLIGNIVESDIYDLFKDRLANIERAVEGNVADGAVMKALSDKYGIPVSTKEE